MAAAEYLGPDKVDGETLLTAIIAGFEVGPRVGLCLNGNKMLAKGGTRPASSAPFLRPSLRAAYWDSTAISSIKRSGSQVRRLPV